MTIIINNINSIITSPVRLRHRHRHTQSTFISLTNLSSSTCIYIRFRSQSHSSPLLPSRFSALCFSFPPGNYNPSFPNTQITHTYMIFDFELFNMGFYLFVRLFCIYLGFKLLKVVTREVGHCEIPM